jgi:hypothetical protein
MADDATCDGYGVGSRPVIRWREGQVVELTHRRAGATELRVATASGELAALAYPDLVGEPVVGDRVLLNVTAIALGLGTGGYALVVAIPDRLPADRDEPGHVVKARYTPLQATVLAVDEQDSPHHEVLRDADDLAGMPVVVAICTRRSPPYSPGFAPTVQRRASSM